MKTGDIARLLGVSGSTIQNWVREFEAYLSPQKSKHRYYTDSDLLALATIAKLSADNLPYAEIHKRLDAGERVESPSEINFGIDTRMVPAAAVEQMIDSTEIRMELEQVKADRDKLAYLLDQSEQSRKELQGKYEAQMEKLNERISQLQHDLGLAQGELNYRRQLDEKRRDE